MYVQLFRLGYLRNLKRILIETSFINKVGKLFFHMKSSSTFEGNLTSEISEGIKLTKVGSALLHYAKIGSWVLTIYYVTTIPLIINNVWFDFYFLMSIYIYRPKETGNFFYTRGIFLSSHDSLWKKKKKSRVLKSVLQPKETTRSLVYFDSNCTSSLYFSSNFKFRRDFFFFF